MIDFHCHLDLFPNPRALIAECEKEKISVLSVTTTPSAWGATKALAGGSKLIDTALGLHPELVHERHFELPLFDRLLPDSPYVGEIGLDHSPGSERHWEIQSRVLSHVLKACEDAGGKIMSLHSRRAAREVLEHLERFPGAGTAVLHWFSSSMADLNDAIKQGCWFSVGPTMLSSKKGRELVARMPRDRVLTESDGPFAQVRGKSATPLDVLHALPLLAQVWEESAVDVRVQLQENLQRLKMMA